MEFNRIISSLRKNNNAIWFKNPFDIIKYQCYDYKDVICKPMDLKTLQTNLNKNEYKRYVDFIRDLDLIWENAFTYNKVGT